MKNENKSFKGNGGTIRLGNYEVHFAEGVLEEGTEVEASEGIKNKDLVNKTMINAGAVPESIKMTGSSCDVVLDNTKLLKSSTITLHYDKKEHGTLRDFFRMKIIQEHEGENYILPTYLDEKKKIIFAETNQFSLIGAKGLLVIFTIAAGVVALPFWYTTKLSITNVNNLQPGDISESDHKKFHVDLDKMELRIEGKILKGLEPAKIERPPLQPKKWIKEDTLSGYCIDWAFLFGSLLIEKEYPVRICTGYFTEVIEGYKRATGHMWIEVVINGEIYVVDTVNPHKGIKLLPRNEAYKLYCINDIDDIDTVFWAEKVPDGYIYYRARENYDPDWWYKYKKDVYELETSNSNMWDYIDTATENLKKYQLKLKAQYQEYYLYLKSGGDGKNYHIRKWDMEKFLEMRELQLKESYHLMGYLQDEFENGDMNWLGITVYKNKNIYGYIEMIKQRQRDYLKEADLEYRLKYEEVMTFWEELYFE